MAEVIVEVRNRDIIVLRPETGQSVTYRRVPEKPTLIVRSSRKCEVSCTDTESSLCPG